MTLRLPPHKPPQPESLETLFKRKEEAEKIADMLWSVTAPGAERLTMRKEGRFAELLKEYNEAQWRKEELSTTLGMAMNQYNHAHKDDGWVVHLYGSESPYFLLERLPFHMGFIMRH